MSKRKSAFETHIEEELKAQTEHNHDQMARLLTIVGIQADSATREKIQYLLFDFQRLTYKQYIIGETQIS